MAPTTLSGDQYAHLVAMYLVKNFAGRGLKLYREVRLGKSIIGKDRKADILCVEQATNRALVIECKIQSTQGTVDEKIPYALQDLAALRTPGVVVYAGEGFSEGVIQMLRAHPGAAYCWPELPDYHPSKRTRELDHVLAQVFNWWDLITQHSREFHLPDSNLAPLASVHPTPINRRPQESK